MPQPAGSFDQLARNFDRFAELVGGPLRAYLESVLPDHGERAADLGCGTGQHAAMLASRYCQVLAVDLSAAMLSLARERRGLANITYAQRDLRSLRPDTDGSFDLVFSAYALHHVPDPEQTLLGIRGLVAPGGRVVLVDNVAPRPAVPRRWFVKEAIRILAGDLLRRRRPAAEALELYQLNTDPSWLEHLTAERFLSPDQFAQRYQAVFPGASLTDLYRARGLCWDAPAGRLA
jgi:ubiquinone/menaquinone biosynthesis C-methylase UbiE